jgi:hypothetical protein
MTRIVRTTYRTKRPPGRKKPVALKVPAVVKAVDPAKASRKGRGPEPAAPPPAPANDDRTPTPPPTAERKSALGPRLHGIAVTGRSLIQQYWSDYDDAALLEIAAETLADLRSGNVRRQDGARQQLQELRTELRRRGVWGDKTEPSGETRTTPDADDPGH